MLERYPDDGPGGQRQRAAGARTLVTNPRPVLADEPTGALDSKATDELLRLFGDINAQGQTILMVSHSVKAASHAGRVLFIQDGELFHQLYRGESTENQFYQKISDALTLLPTGGERASAGDFIAPWRGRASGTTRMCTPPQPWPTLDC